MSRSTAATSWSVVDSDKEGATLSLDFTCPYCGMSNAVLTVVYGDVEDLLESSFETDQDCFACGKTVTVECGSFNKD